MSVLLQRCALLEVAQFGLTCVICLVLLANAAALESVPFMRSCKDATADEDCALRGDVFGGFESCFDLKNDPLCLEGKCNYAVKNVTPPFCCDPNSPSLNTTRQALKMFVPVRTTYDPSPCHDLGLDHGVEILCNTFDDHNACPACQGPSEPYCEETACSVAGVCECVPVIPRPGDGCPKIDCLGCPNGTVCDGDTGDCVECRGETDCPKIGSLCLTNRRCAENKCVYDGCPEGHVCSGKGRCVKFKRNLQGEECQCEDQFIDNLNPVVERSCRSRRSQYGD